MKQLINQFCIKHDLVLSEDVHPMYCFEAISEQDRNGRPRVYIFSIQQIETDIKENIVPNLITDWYDILVKGAGEKR